MDAAQRHNLVEKKRREKINNKLEELKIIIGFDEYNKITQYDILDKAIEYINLLKKENDEYKNKLEKKVKKKDKDIEKITEGIQKTKI
jgi:hypothetical protein